jgi:hypothetical protein
MNNPNLYGPVLFPNTQNYLIKTTTNVYWMNSRAYYPYQNFLKIFRFFESAISEQELVDSINATLGPYRTLNPYACPSENGIMQTFESAFNKASQ